MSDLILPTDSQKRSAFEGNEFVDVVGYVTTFEDPNIVVTQVPVMKMFDVFEEGVHILDPMEQRESASTYRLVLNSLINQAVENGRMDGKVTGKAVKNIISMIRRPL